MHDVELAYRSERRRALKKGRQLGTNSTQAPPLTMYVSESKPSVLGWTYSCSTAVTTARALTPPGRLRQRCLQALPRAALAPFGQPAGSGGLPAPLALPGTPRRTRTSSRSSSSPRTAQPQTCGGQAGRGRRARRQSACAEQGAGGRQLPGASLTPSCTSNAAPAVLWTSLHVSLREEDVSEAVFCPTVIVLFTRLAEQKAALAPTALLPHPCTCLQLCFGPNHP